MTRTLPNQLKDVIALLAKRRPPRYGLTLVSASERRAILRVLRQVDKAWMKDRQRTGSLTGPVLD